MSSINDEFKISGNLGMRIYDPRTNTELEAIREECLQVFGSWRAYSPWYISLGTIYAHNETELNCIMKQMQEVFTAVFTEFSLAPAGTVEQVYDTECSTSLICKLHIWNPMGNIYSNVVDTLCTLVNEIVLSQGGKINQSSFPHITIGKAFPRKQGRPILLPVSARLSPILFYPQCVEFFPLETPLEKGNRLDRKRERPFEDSDLPPSKYKRTLSPPYDKPFSDLNLSSPIETSENTNGGLA